MKKGFSEQNITIVKDANYATMKRVLQEFEDQLNPGDVAVIHYSGHGQQIMDDNGDEPDGYDEALIPVDAHAKYEKGEYEGERHLRDDEFGEDLKGDKKQAYPVRQSVGWWLMPVILELLSGVKLCQKHEGL